MEDSPRIPDHDSDNVIGQRLKFEMKKRGINATELAKRADVKASFIYDVISGKSANPSTVKLARVVGALEISLAHLVDRGAQHLPPNLSTEHFISIPRLSVDLSSTNARIISEIHDNEPFLFRKSWVLQHLMVNLADIRIFTMRGDSMEPTLYQGNVLLLDISQTTPSNPGCFVIYDGMGLAVKRLEYMGSHSASRIRILSDNPQYSAYECDAAETNIIGRVVWVAHEI